MCGVGGCAMPAGVAPDREALERMRLALAHRGPDDSAIAVTGGVGLVHTRLAIVDPGSGRQPLRDPATGAVLSYNGEVFNHLELRRQLGERSFTGSSDTETVLAAIGSWGLKALERFNGFFALALLDSRAGRLTLARDRFGVKSLYVAEHRGGVWFATELRALFAAGIPRRPEPGTVEQILRRTWSLGAPTPIVGVRSVHAGDAVEIELETLKRRSRRWYRPTDSVDPELAGRLARNSRRANLRLLEEQLEQSVERRMMADVPLGTMCSGGIDSSLVTAFARRIEPSIAIYCAPVPDQPELDEGPWARMVCERVGADLREVPVTAASFRAGLVRAVDHYEFPSPHVSMVPIAAIAARARREGVKAILVGEAADELFGGYSLTIQRQLADLRDDRSGVRLLARRLRRALADRRPSARRAAPAPDSFRPSIAARREIDRRVRRAYHHHPDPERSLEAAIARQLEVGPLPTLLNRLDRNGMQGSVEMREPFLDAGMVELALNLPARDRVAPRSKGILRELAGRHLGPEIEARPKQPFRFAVRDYIRSAASIEFLLDGALRELLRAPAGRWARSVGSARPQEEFLLWSGEIWARLLIEGHSVERVERELWPDGPDGLRDRRRRSRR